METDIKLERLDKLLNLLECQQKTNIALSELVMNMRDQYEKRISEVKPRAVMSVKR